MRNTLLIAIPVLATLPGCGSTDKEKHEEARIAALQIDFNAERRAILAKLDAFHAAASHSDLAAYTATFAPDMIFLGTDAKERWNGAEFTAYAKMHFDKQEGWTYVPVQGTRFVNFDPQGTAAWFDETVSHEKYGLLRGTGAARKIGGQWLISQYSLTFLVPNQVADKVTQLNKSVK